MNIQLQYEPYRIFAENNEGETIAEITFSRVSNGVVSIDHTFVDESLRGQGVADQLMRAMTTFVLEHHDKAIAACPYAKLWATKHPETQSLFIDQDS